MAADLRTQGKLAGRIKKAGLKSKLKMFLITVVLVFLSISFFWGEFGFFRIWILSKKIDRLQKEISYLQVQKMDLLWETEKIKNDPDYMQRYAIQKYGYARPDQRVIQFVHPEAASSTQVKQALDPVKPSRK